MKKLLTILPIILMLSFIIGCNCTSDCKTNKDQVAVEKQNMAMIEQMWKDWNNREYDKVDAIFADDVMYYSPYGNPIGMNREETKLTVEHLWKGNPDIKAEIVKLVADGNTVTQMLMMTGTNTGDFNGMPATNKEFKFGIISLFVFEDGKLLEANEAADFFGFLKQIGAI